MAIQWQTTHDFSPLYIDVCIPLTIQVNCIFEIVLKTHFKIPFSLDD